jgi:hypothetical protein
VRDVRVDADGALRCWSCGGKNFLAKRTGRAHIVGYLTVGVGALATKKKLKCQQCGQYNQTGKARPMGGGGAPPTWPTHAVPTAPEASAPTPPPPPPPPAGPPEGWYADPHREATERWWDGSTWTGATR